MYEDRRETFSIKDIFLQLLFIILLVFILIWLFPTKGYLEKKLDGIQAGIDEKLQPLYTRLFTDNILTMKDAAKSYFTTPRLPQNVGDKVTMTLKEMYEKGLLLELVDSNNNACDANKSYIELTKMEEEYQLKVTLSCSDKEAYIIEYLGCYDYCSGLLCTKEESKANQTKSNVTPVKTYTCRLVDGYYWGSEAKIVDQATFVSQCTTPTPDNPTPVQPEPTYTCKYVGGKYWGSNAEVVDQATYIKQCTTQPSEEKYTCKYVSGQYWGSNSTVVDKDTYLKQCTSEPEPEPTYTCKYVNGQYWGKNATKVTAAEYKKQCTSEPEPTYTCQIVNGQYWGKNATTVTEAEYKEQCSTPVTPTRYKYQYVLRVGGKCGSYGSWSDWTTNKIEENDNTKVQTKTEKVLDHYEQIYTVVDTIYENQDYYEDVYYGYSTRTIKKTATYNYTTKTTTTVLSYATKTYRKTATYDYIYTTNTVEVPVPGETTSTWVVTGTTSSRSPLASTATVRYTETGRETSLACEPNCETVTTYYYRVEELRTTTTGGGTTTQTVTTKSCPAGTSDNGSGCVVSTDVTEKYCPTGTDNGSGCVVVNVEKYCAQGTDTGSGCQVVSYVKQNYCSANGTDTGSGCVVKVKKTKRVGKLVYGYIDGDPVYRNVTYYRSATRTCTNDTVDYQWSESDNDAALKAKGYTLTGVKEKIQ